jgi:glycosyltransferase involved in cell wall biosynthesis
MSSTPLCSIIIRAFNEEDHIGRLLTGIEEQTLKDIEIIVIDSGSTDATVAIASRFPTRILSLAPDEFTFGRSLNIGCDAAKGDFLVFASAHVYPCYPDWLERLLAPFNDTSIGLVYGMQRGDGGTRYSEHQQFKRMYPNTSVLTQKHPLCNNANAAIRRSFCAAEAAVIHVHNESPRQVLNRYKREAIALARIRPEESFSVLDLLNLTISNIINDLRSAVVDRRFTKVFWSVVWFRTMQYLGTYLGFRHGEPVTDEVIRAFYYPEEVMGRREETKRPVDPIDYSRVTHGLDKVERDESSS